MALHGVGIMALAFRFDSIKVNADGSISVEYTHGQAPLSAKASGVGTSFNSRQSAVAMKNRILQQFDEETMMMLAMAVYSIAASDPGLTGAMALVGKTLTIDPTKPNSVMSYT